MHILSTFKQPIFCHLKGRDCYNKVSNSPNFNDHKTKRLIIYGLRKRHNWSSQFEMSILKAKTNTQANLKTFLVKSIFSVKAYVTCVCLLVCIHFHIGFNSSKDHTLQALLINFVKEFYLIFFKLKSNLFYMEQKLLYLFKIWPSLLPPCYPKLKLLLLSPYFLWFAIYCCS